MPGGRAWDRWVWPVGETAVVDDLDSSVAAVYAGPAEGFVAVRAALVKQQLKADGVKDDAAATAARRRPTKPALELARS